MLPSDTFTFFLSDPNKSLSDEVGYSPGKKLYCPKCNSEKISIFFKPGFSGKDLGNWCDYMAENNFELCNKWEIIKKSNYNPNWICKDCYDGGVILRI